MLFKRQKILLALLEEFGGSLKNTDLQKYLFLLSKHQQEQSYHFVPYKYGRFSFQAYQDKRNLTEKGFLKASDDWKLSLNGHFREMLSSQDAHDIWQIKKEYGHLSGDQLVRHVYKRYPYYAINSEIALRILDEKDLTAVENEKPTKTIAI